MEHGDRHRSSENCFSMIKKLQRKKSIKKPRKAVAHYDVQSAAWNFAKMAKRRQNNANLFGTSVALSLELSGAINVDKKQENGTRNPEERKVNDQSDNKSNVLVASCPYFRNEIGGEQEEVFGAFRYNSSYKTMSGTRRHSTIDVIRAAYDSTRRGQMFNAAGVSILDPINKQVDTSLEHVDHGAFYYRQFFFNQGNRDIVFYLRHTSTYIREFGKTVGRVGRKI